MKIGLLSDTHGYLDPEIFKVFAPCDEIWHAGDVGDIDIIDRLEAFKPTIGVYGNIDNASIRATWPLDILQEREGVKIFMTHICGKPYKYYKRAREIIGMEKPNLVICGHSHILKVMYDKKLNHLHMNPGACGHHGFHIMRTALRFDLMEGKITNAEVIELGKRGRT